MMQMINHDAMMYVLLRRHKAYMKAGHKVKAQTVMEIMRELQEELPGIKAEHCPFCRGRFSIAREEEFYDEDT